MSATEARKVVSRAVTDNQFRELLFENPEKALAGYQLSAVEVEALRGIPSETIDDFSNNLDERISMSVLNFAIRSMIAGDPQIDGTGYNEPVLDSAPMPAGDPQPDFDRSTLEIDGAPMPAGDPQLDFDRGTLEIDGAPMPAGDPQLDFAGNVLDGSEPAIDSAELAGASLAGANLASSPWLTRLFEALGLAGKGIDLD